jgi:hypothetical protein
VTTVTLYPTEAAELRRSAHLTALQVTPPSRLLVEERAVSLLADKPYGTRKFITTFTTVCNLPYTEPDESNPHPPILRLLRFNTILSSQLQTYPAQVDPGGHSLAEIAGSNPAGDMDVCLL